MPPQKIEMYEIIAKYLEEIGCTVGDKIGEHVIPFWFRKNETGTYSFTLCQDLLYLNFKPADKYSGYMWKNFYLSDPDCFDHMKNWIADVYAYHDYGKFRHATSFDKIVKYLRNYG